MKKALIVGVSLLALAGSTAVYAQHRMHREPPQRMSVEDRGAFLDARIAAVHAGLKLNADQEKNWPAVETAVRELAKLRMDRANARISERDARRADQGRNNADRSNATPPDPVVRLRERADDMSSTGAALKKLVDAADPLYKSLDDGQKRRLMRLTAGGLGREGRGWDRRERFERPTNFDGPRGRDDGPRDGGFRRGGPDGPRNGPDGGPDRL